MQNNSNKRDINRGDQRKSAPRHHARINLGDTRKESMGEWLFNHRIGLLVVFAVFVLAGTVLATARYHVERIDLEYLIEIIPEEFKEENKKLREIITDLSKSNYKSVNQRNNLERENKKLKEERDSRKDEYKKVIDRENERVYNCNEYYAETMETRRKNMELKERIAELEKCNLNLQEQIDKLLNHNK